MKTHNLLTKLIGSADGLSETSKTILERFGVRKTKQQKEAFASFLKERYPALTIEEGGLVKSRNLIVGDAERADVLLTAHYDTCAVMPFPNFLTPKNLAAYLGYMLLLIAGMIVLLGVAAFVLCLLVGSDAPFPFVYDGGLLLLLALMMAGPANKHTVNDNTSGVLLLCELMERMSEEEKKKAAFVFFDNEEIGLFGSAFFRKKHKKAMRHKLLINFDCVSDGDTLMAVLPKAAEARYGKALRLAFNGAAEKKGKAMLFASSANTLYPSDQMGFRYGVGVAAFRKRPLIGLYMSRIHTPRDLVLDEANLEILCEGILAFLRGGAADAKGV